MRKTMRKIITGLLSLSMVTTLFAGIPVKAEEEEEAVYGLLAAEWLDSDWDDQGEYMLVTEEGFPGSYRWGEDGEPECDASGKPIIDSIPFGGDWSGASTGYLSGRRYYFVYKESADAKPVPVKAEDLELRYYTISEGNWFYDDTMEYLNTKNYVTGKGLLQNDPDQERWKGVVDFFPDDSYNPSNENGFYVCVYKGSDKAIDALPIRVDYPEIGFYSAPEQTRENLLLNQFSGNSADYTLFWGEDVTREVYLHLVSTEESELTLADGTAINDDDGEERPAFELEMDGFSVNSEESDFYDYVDVEEQDEEGWYKLTFADEMIVPADDEDEESEEYVADWFSLRVNVVRVNKQYDEENEEWLDEWYDEENDEWYSDKYYEDAWLNGEYKNFATGLYAQVEGFDDINAEGVDTVYLEATPHFLRMAFGQSTLSDDGIPQRKQFTAEELEKLEFSVEKSDSYDEDNGIPTDWDGSPAEWEAATVGVDYDCTLDGEYVRFESYYQRYYRVSVKGIEGAVLIHAGMNALAFFDSNKRPADEERIENRIAEITVDEGKTDTVYMLAWVDPEVDWAPNLEKLKITAEVDGKEVPSYIDATNVIKDEDGNISGCEVKITDQAKEDFTIVATAEKNGAAEIDPAWNTDREELAVTINKLKELKIATAPTKVAYNEGDKFDAAGMVVKAVYEDGKEELITNYTVTAPAELKATDTAITVSYLGKTVKQNITVKAKAAASTQPNATKAPTVEKKGTTVKDSKSKADYTVSGSDSKNPTVEYKAASNKKAKNVTVPDTVEINGVKYKVTSIAKNAFKGNKKLTKVTIGSNIETIGKNAFNGCKNLKTVTIKSKKLTSKSVGNGAFKGINKKATVKVPKGKAASYKKLFKKKGLPSKAKVK